MSFCLRPNVCKKCGKPLTIFEGWICLECEKTGQEPCDECQYNHTSICGNCKRYDEFEEIDYFVQEHKKIPVTLDLTPCDDAISREDATAEFIKWQTEVAYAFGQDYLGVRIIQSAIDTIRELPSVMQLSAKDYLDMADRKAKKIKDALTVTQKSGKWIDEGRYAEGHSEHAYRCSECDEHYIGYVGEYKFCPNCGARMAEPQESEDKE